VVALAPGLQPFAVEDQREFIDQRFLDRVDAEQRLELFRALARRVDGLKQAQFAHAGHAPTLLRITPYPSLE
jgi:hypothetical protein